MNTRVALVVQHLRETVQAESVSALRDTDLLECLAGPCAEEAFAVLVERHGPMILGVCRRILRNTHDADDALQATFLVLARRAAAIRRPDSLAAWLHGVALRLALNMKREASKRRQHENRAVPRPSAAPLDLGMRELHLALDEELQRLPENHRQPLLLCYLQGLTQEAAAEQLAWPRGTLKRRLERGRELLKARLTQRGLTLGVALLATLPAGEALAVPLPATLAGTTIKAAALVAAGQAAAVSVGSARAVALADGVIKAMLLAKLGKLTAILMLALVCCGLGFAGYSGIATGQSEKTQVGEDRPGLLPVEKKLNPATVPRAAEEAAKLREQFKANAAEFEIYISRHGQGDAKIDLQSIVLHASNRRFEPSALGPSGKPIFKTARISKEQALKIIDALSKWPAFIFTNGKVDSKPVPERAAFISTMITYGPDANPGPRLHLTDWWGWHMIGHFSNLQSQLDGEAAKLLEELQSAISSEAPKREKPGKNDGAATGKHFEALAKQLEVFQTGEFAAGRADSTALWSRFAPKDMTDVWLKINKALVTGKDDMADLVGLLKHDNPRVRTLAMAALFERQDPGMLPHLAAMVGDQARTAPEVEIRRAVSAIGPDVELLPQDISQQTVGHVAQVFLKSWLEPAGYTLEGFESYWAARKDRKFCASWFVVRLRRAGQASSHFDPSRAPLIRAVRKEIDALPAVDRDWTLLWVAAHHHRSISEEPGRILASSQELLDAGKRLGPDRLMELIADRPISTDPDLAAKDRRTRGRDDLILWVLWHAGKLLRPEDAPALLDLENVLRGRPPAGVIAAAELQPANAGKWLHAAMDRYQAKGKSSAWARAGLAAGLWRLVGETEMGYLADWFYNEQVDKNPHSPQTQQFLEEVRGVRGPADRRLVARLVADPRLDKLDYQSLRAVVEVVNRWTKQPVVGNQELRPNWEKGTWGPETAGDFKLLAQWRHKLRKSVDDWQ